MKKHRMNKKEKKRLYVIIGIVSSIILLISVLYFGGVLSTVFSPQTPDDSLDKYINKYYFPVVDKPTTKIVASNNERYFCDSKSNTIYYIAPGKTSKKIVDRCKTGCEVVQKTIDSGTVTIAKCKGDYKPSIKTCSSDGSKFFTTDKLGTLTTTYCCSCKYSRCVAGCAPVKPPVITPPPSPCKLLSGPGKTDNKEINIFIYNDASDKEYYKWVLSEYSSRAPFNKITWNVYHEDTKYACRNIITQRGKDIRIGFDYISWCPNCYGWGQPPAGTGQPGELTFSTWNPNKHWSFLLFHESGHIYTRWGHSNDGSIMDANGGDGQFRQYQVDWIYKNMMVNDY